MQIQVISFLLLLLQINILLAALEQHKFIISQFLCVRSLCELSWISAQEIHKAGMLTGLESFLDMRMNLHLGSFRSQHN